MAKTAANTAASTAATEVADEPTADYQVVSPLDHNQTFYNTGATVALSAAQAAALLGHTVIVPVAEKHEE